MAEQDDDRLLVLLGLRLKGFAAADGIADVIDMDTTRVGSALEVAVSEGLVRHNADRDVYMLDPATGRPEGERLLAEQLDSVDGRSAVVSAYSDFLGLNQAMLQLCTDWQIRADLDEQTLNDHADEDYDQDVIGRLVELDDALRKVLAQLRSALARYGSYAPRFRNALDRLLGGEIEYFTKPIIPSYHTVWFELHEDLLATQGIDRATEGST